MEEIATKIFKDLFLVGKTAEGYVSGSSTYVYPLTIWKESKTAEILIKTDPRYNKRHFNAFLKKMRQQHPEIVSAYFERNDLSVPDKLIFHFE